MLISKHSLVALENLAASVLQPVLDALVYLKQEASVCEFEDRSLAIPGE